MGGAFGSRATVALFSHKTHCIRKSIELTSESSVFKKTMGHLVLADGCCPTCPARPQFTSVHRADPHDPTAHAYAAEEGLTPEQALLGHTAHAAEATMLGAYVGALRPGMRADLVLLSSSPLTMRRGDPLPRVLETVVDGQCAWAVSGC